MNESQVDTLIMKTELIGWDYAKITAICPSQCAWEYTWTDAVSIGEVQRIVREHLEHGFEATHR